MAKFIVKGEPVRIKGERRMPGKPVDLDPTQDTKLIGELERGGLIERDPEELAAEVAAQEEQAAQAVLEEQAQAQQEVAATAPADASAAPAETQAKPAKAAAKSKA